MRISRLCWCNISVHSKRTVYLFIAKTNCVTLSCNYNTHI
ncbi:hypothetical protein HMPREF3190_01705 [Umbribacter vaginalis]|nr:hypothetical protein HMPREF3190_01705 [Coriobacteriales bacterium DNF00809]